MRTHYRYIAFLAGITAFYFFPVVVSGKTFLPTDLLSLWYPWKHYSMPWVLVKNSYLMDAIDQFYPQDTVYNKALKNWSLALWDPDTLCGHPVMADMQSAQLYPSRVFLHLLFSPSVAHDINLFLHLILMGTGMYVFLVFAGVRPWAACIGAIGWMFSGPITVYLELERVSLISGALLPWGLACIELWVRKRKPFSLVGLGAIVGFILLSGHLKFGLYALGCLALYYIFMTPCWRDIVYLALAIGSGMGLAASQLIPNIELFLHSNYAQGTINIASISGFFPLEYFVTLFIPDFFGNPVRGVYFVRGAERIYQNYSELCAYIGIIPIVMSLMGIIYGQGKRKYFFLSLAAMSLLISMNTWLTGFLPFSATVNQLKILFLTSFSLCALASFGADACFPPKWPSVLTSLLFLVISVGMLALGGPFLARIFVENTILSGAAPSPEYFSLSNSAYYMPLLFIFLFLLSLVMYGRKIISLSEARAFAVILTAIDLVYFGMTFNTYGKRDDVFPQTPGIEYLQSQKGLYRVMTLGLHSNLLLPFSIPEIGGYDALIPFHYLDFANAIGRDTRASQLSIYISFSRLPRSILDLLNIRFIVAPPYVDLVLEGVKLIYRNDLSIYENVRVFPRAIPMFQYEVVSDQSKILERIARGGNDLLHRILFMEAPDHHPLPLNGRDGHDESRAEIVSYRSDEVVIQADMEHDGFLFLSDSYFPGWKATVDSREEKIYRADYNFRAVYVEKGHHIVVFTYSPLSFLSGSILSMISLAGFLVFVKIR